MRSGALVGIALGAAALLFPLQSSLDALRPVEPSSFLYMPSKRLMRVVACGHGPTLAELVWVQSNNYVIDQFKSGKSHIEYLYSLYDTITELDPDSVDAYVLGAVFLSSVAQEPDQSLRLLQKGEGVLLEQKDGRFAEDPTRPGLVDPDHPERWKLLNEHAATYLVCYATDAPTPDEREAEIRRAGRLWLFGADRYPVSKYPTVPDWFHAMGHNLAHRRIGALERAQYREAVNYLLDVKIFAAGPDSPVTAVYKRRKLEVEAGAKLEDLQLALEAWRGAHGGATPGNLGVLVRPSGPLGSLPADPLGIGYFLVGGKVVAPALDAARLERAYGRAASEFHIVHDAWPQSLDELRTDLARRGAELPPIPAWVQLHYDPATGEVDAVGRRPS